MTISYNLLQIIVVLWSLNIYFFFTKLVVSKVKEDETGISRTNLNSCGHFQCTLVCNYSRRTLRCWCRWHFRYNCESCSGIRLSLNDNFSKYQIYSPWTKYSHQYNITIYFTVKNAFPFSQWFQNMTSVTSQTKAKCFKWILKKPKNFTCTIVSITFVPWLTGASEWSLGIMAQSFLVTAFKICVTFVYVWNKITINWQ